MDGKHVSIREEIADMFSMSRDLLYQQLEGVDDRFWRERSGEANAPLWILAHLVVSRNNVIRVITGDQEPAFPWEAAAQRGSSGDPAGLPDVAALKQLFEGRHNSMIAAMRAISDEDLAEPAPGAPVWRRRMLLGSFMHECHHVGQIAHARRAAGYPSVDGSEGRKPQ